MKHLNIVMLSTVLFSLTAYETALAADGAELYVQKTCSTCHGADGNTPVVATYPKLAGQSPEYLVQQLKDFQSGARSNAQSGVMKGIVQALSDDDFSAISKYLSELKAKD